MNNIDKLFKEKLQLHEVAPSTNAWKKLELLLTNEKSKKGIIWMNIAAAVVIIIASITYFKLNTTDDTTTQIAQLTTGKTNIEPVEESQTTTIEEQPISINNLDIVSQEIKPKTTTTPGSTPKKRSSPAINSQAILAETLLESQHNTPTDDIVEETDKDTFTDLIAHNESPVVVQEEAIQENITKSSSVIIIYNLQPAVKIDSSILEKKRIESKTKGNMFGKIVAFAKNAKSSEIGLGQLRAAKDDFLSFDNLINPKEPQQ